MPLRDFSQLFEDAWRLPHQSYFTPPSTRSERMALEMSPPKRAETVRPLLSVAMIAVDRRAVLSAADGPIETKSDPGSTVKAARDEREGRNSCTSAPRASIEPDHPCSIAKPRFT